MEIDKMPEQPLTLSQKDAEEIVAAVKSLYSGKESPGRIRTNDSLLRVVQRSALGFQIADALLDSDDTSVRLFAISTFVVKINRDWNTLEPQQKIGLVNRLMDNMIISVLIEESALVTIKLCAALISVFKQIPGDWTYCVEHVVRSLAAGARTEYSQSPGDIGPTVGELSGRKLRAAVWYARALAEDCGGLDVESTVNHSIHQAVFANINAVLTLLVRTVDAKDDDFQHKSEIAKDGMEVLMEFIKYVHRKPLADTVKVLDSIRTVFLWLIHQLRDGQLLVPIVELLEETLSDYDSFFTDQLETVLFLNLINKSSTTKVWGLISGETSEDLLPHASLLVTYGLAWTERIVIPKHRGMDILLQMLGSLMKVPGWPIEDDIVAPRLLEFWTKYTETALAKRPTDSGQGKPPWLSVAEAGAEQALIHFVLKVQLPPHAIFSEWERQVQLEYHALRAEFRDFSASAYALIGPSLLSRLVDHAITPYSASNWQEMETVIQAIRGVVEVALDGGELDRALITFFSSPLIGVLADETKDIPVIVHKAVLQLISECAGFFKRNPTWLPHIIGVLFACLKDPKQMLDAAKTYATICDLCRNDLTKLSRSAHICNIAVFMNTDRPSEVKEKVIFAVACTLQVIWATMFSGSWEWRQNKVSFFTLFDLIEQDFKPAHMNQFSNESRTRVLTGVRCLAAFGKAFRAPDSHIIDLEDDSTPALPADLELRKEALSLIQECRDTCVILKLKNALSYYPDDGEIMEAVCDVVSAGLTEKPGNPFVVPLEFVESLLHNYIEKTPRVARLLQTVGPFLKTVSSNPSQETLMSALRCLEAPLQLFEMRKEDLREDPELPMSVMNFVYSYFSSFPQVLFSEQVLSNLGSFLEATIRCLTFPEHVIRQSAGSFWSHLLEYRSPDLETMQRITRTIDIHGQNLATALMIGIGGDAPRSDLAHLSQPLRKLVYARGDNARIWLERAMAMEGVMPTAKVTGEDKQKFLQAVIRLRGNLKTNQVVKDFWVKCKGTFA